MRKCLEGKVYDTDKSQRVAFNYTETLYRSRRTRQFFLVLDDTKHIILFTDLMAKDWLYNYAPDELDHFFPGWEPLEA